jgi:hypothetical protein
MMNRKNHDTSNIKGKIIIEKPGISYPKKTLPAGAGKIQT